jgi:hypothetical protein
MSFPGYSSDEVLGPGPAKGFKQIGQPQMPAPVMPGQGSYHPDDVLGAPPVEQNGLFKGTADLGAAMFADFTRPSDPNAGSSTPALDHYFQSTSAGQMLAKFGQDVTAPFSQQDALATTDNGKGLDFLKRSGDYKQWAANHGATTDTFRNTTMRPSAMDAMREAQMLTGWGGEAIKTYFGGFGPAVDQLRRDLVDGKDDLRQLDGAPWEAKVVPYIHNFLLQSGGEGRIAAEVFDSGMLAFALTGIPQAIGWTNHQLASATVHAMPMPGDTPQQQDQRISNMEGQLGFYEMFVGPERGLGYHLNIARRLDAAKNAGVIGKPPLFTNTGTDIKAANQGHEDQLKGAGVEPAAQPQPGVVHTDLTPSAPPLVEPERPSVENPQQDVHGVARAANPELFAQYDPLAARHAWYVDWINTLRAQKENDPRLARAQAEIDGILAKVNGVESRLTNRARARIADIRGGMQDFLDTDTPDMARVKEKMLENFQQMQPLQTQVQAAYREAAQRMAADAAERGEGAPVQTAPAPAPEPEVINPVQTFPPNIGEMAAELQPVNVPRETIVPRTDLPAETAHIQTPADIAVDASRQLQAAGVSKEVADTYGQIAAARYTARAARLEGRAGTAAELYREEGPVWQGVGRRPAAGQRTLAQRTVKKAQSIVDKMPGLRRIMPDLTPEERTEVTSRNAKQLFDLWSQLPARDQEMASVAFAGRAKRGWYQQAAKAIHELFGPADADRFTALLAAQSPQTSVEDNLLNSLKTWVNWDKAGRPTDPKTIKKILGQSVQGLKGEKSVLDAWVNNSMRALTHEDPAKLLLSGPKVDSFMNNLRGFVDHVTNDSWMATYFGLDPEEFAAARRKNKIDVFGKTFGFKSPGYLAVTAKARRVAGILTERTGETWTPAEVQETVWSWTKTLMERRDRAGEDRTVQQILKAGDLTHEDVAGASDFASLLVNGIYSNILEEGGYGDELEKLRAAADERAAANRPTGPSVSVTGAEGSGIAQPAFERHLQQAATRLERNRAAGLTEDARTQAKKAAKSEIAANLSAATPTIPGIQQLADAANKGDVTAHRMVNLIAHDHLTRLMSGIPGVELETTENGGLYEKTLEPSLGIRVHFPEKQRANVLAALGKFADNFDQKQIHVRQETIDEPGRVNPDGSWATPVYRIELKTPLTREEIQHHIDTSGLIGLTFNDKMVEAYHFTDNPRDDKGLAEFLDNVKKLKESLGENGGRVQQRVDRLWAYGRGYGATAGYDAIAGELPPATAQFTRVPRALAERELGHEVTPAEQAGELTPEQRAVNERVYQHFDELPENDLANPLVARAYDALARVVDRQIGGLPIKYEAWADFKDGKWVPREGQPYDSSRAMRDDVLHNNHMWFYVTDADSFGPPGQDFSFHPLLKETGRKASNGYPMRANDELRVVHDYYAHTMSPVDFGPKGEEAAWRNHMATMDDPWARWALTSETRGQNSWVNFRPGMEQLRLVDRGYAPQKAALLPIGDTLTGDDYIDLPMLELERELTPRQAQGSLSDEFERSFGQGAVQPTFYSGLTRAVDRMVQNKAPAPEWSRIIDSLPGVKREEIEWSGIKDWLAGQRGVVTRQQIVDQLRANEVQLKEINKGPVGGTRSDEELYERARDLASDDGQYFGDLASWEKDHYLRRAAQEPYPSTKFEEYTLPGGKNYREMLLTLPEKNTPLNWTTRHNQEETDYAGHEMRDVLDAHGFVRATLPADEVADYMRREAKISGDLKTQNFRSGHWDEPNVLAHIRFDDRTGPDGEKVLHIAEVQSDWHQKGRKEGYDLPGMGEEWAVYKDNRRIAEQLTRAEAQRIATETGGHADQTGFSRRGGVPNAPFKASWHELAMKRMLRYAVDNGYDRISWDTGATNAERYDLSKQVSGVHWARRDNDTFDVTVRGMDNDVIAQRDGISHNALADLIGKEPADKIAKGEGGIGQSPTRGYSDAGVLKGEGLKVGGEGMRGFYDRILPQFMAKYVKKWDGKVEDIQVPARAPGDTGIRGRAHPYGVEYDLEKPTEYHVYRTADEQRIATFKTHAEATDFIAQRLAQEEGGATAHSVAITDAMRDSVQEGQPLFQPDRGKIRFRKNGPPIIELMKKADPSTLIHESGHAWLEELMRDAQRPDAPAQLKMDAAIVREWLGFGEGQEIPDGAHEKWARGFERYVMEGIAPSKELATAFARFKQWLVRIYQTVTRLRSPINDDIRAVFDRMLTEPDQPTIIAEPRNTARVMADMHEVEQHTVTPDQAGATMDAIAKETESQLRRVAPEEHDAFLRSEIEGGAQQTANAPSGGRVHEAKPLAGPTSGHAAAGPLVTGGHEPGPASSQLRATAIKEGAGAGAGPGGGGAGESVEERIARRLAGRSAGPGQQPSGGGRGLETPGTGPLVSSELAVNTQARAIAAGMPEETVGEVMQHQQLSRAEQSELAAQLLNQDPNTARDIAMGRRPAPQGLMSIFVYKAVEQRAIAAGDWATINELANSKLLDSVTDAGRILNALSEQDPSNPVAAIKRVNQARAANSRTLAQRGMPTQVTPAEAQRLTDAAARLKEAQDDWAAHGNDQEDRLRRLRVGNRKMDLIETIENMKPQTKFWSWNTLFNVWATPKSAETSVLHFSAPFVQGRGLIATSYWWKGFPQMFRYFGNEQNFRDLNAWIITHPDYQLLEQAHVSLGKLGDKVSEREEAIQSALPQAASHWLSEHTGLPDVIKASSRAFTGYLNYIRASYFYDLIAAARARGEDLGPESRNVRDIGNLINDFTGRGNLGVNDSLGNVAPAANLLLYTVRKISGTMNMFNPERYLNPNISKTARIAAFQQLMGHMATTASVIGLARAVGLNINFDPDSSDFLLLKVGDTAFDLSGGSITYARMWMRMLKWSWHHYIENDTSTKTAGRTAYEDIGNYFRNSLSPMASMIADAMYGSDPAGRPFDITHEMMEKLLPLTVGEFIDFAAHDPQNYTALMLSPLSMFGVRMKTPLAPKSLLGMNVWGQPSGPMNGYFDRPLNDPVDQELKQLNYNMRFPNKVIKGVKLTTDQYKAYIQQSGQLAKESIENDMGLPGWADYPPEQKLFMIQSDVNAARRDAADQIMADDLSTAEPGLSIMDQATAIYNKRRGINQ